MEICWASKRSLFDFEDRHLVDMAMRFPIRLAASRGARAAMRLLAVVGAAAAMAADTCELSVRPLLGVMTVGGQVTAVRLDALSAGFFSETLPARPCQLSVGMNAPQVEPMGYIRL